MESSPPQHPTDETLASYGLGKLDDTLAERVDQHLEECVACRQRVAELSSDSFLGRLRQARAGHDHKPSASTFCVERQTGPGTSEHEPTFSSPPLSGGTPPPELANDPHWDVLRELGRGGMGCVYLARNRMLDRLEVLKVLNNERLARPGADDRFLREMQSAARLHHPNVVAAYAASRIGDLLIFAMEYVKGDDLAKLVREGGALPAATACSYGFQAAQGLQHAHERGMIHRDIKPGNLILFRQGNTAIVKVLDFGLAKIRSADYRLDDSISPRRDNAALTHEGQILGTPDYIAPEQTLDAQEADVQSDIYSLGCTLYYLMTAKPPFNGKSVSEVLLAHRAVDAAPLNKVRPDVPAELAAIVAKMMEKKPDRRYQTAAAVARALKPFCDPDSLTGSESGLSQNAPRQKPSSTVVRSLNASDHDNPPLAAMARSSAEAANGLAHLPIVRSRRSLKVAVPLIVVGAAICAALALSFGHGHGWLNLSNIRSRQAGAPKGDENVMALPPAQPVVLTPTSHGVATPREAVQAAFPGKRLSANKPGRTVLQYQHKEILALRGHTGAVHAVAVSLDGKWIGSGSSDNTVRLWDASIGAEKRTLTGHSNWISTVAFSPDSQRLASGAADGTIRLWDVATGNAGLTLAAHSARVTSVGFSRDGSRIVSGGADNAVKIWNAVTGEAMRTLEGKAEIWSAVFSPDGKRILAGGADNAVKVWDAVTGQEMLTLKDTGRVESVTFSPDGSRILAACWDAKTLRLWDAATGADIRTIKSHDGVVHTAAFSPDANWIVSGSEDGTIKLFDASTGAEALTLNGHTADVRGVAFSPDGKRIISAGDDATIRIWSAPATDAADTGALQVEIIRPGRGEQEAKRGDFLTVNYRTTLLEGRLVDSTYADGRRPLIFRLGSDPVVKGWHLGLVGMKFGEKRRLTIPAELAYGPKGRSRAGIPPNATLISEIELLSIHDGTPHRVKTGP